MSVSSRASPHEAAGGPGRQASHRLDRQAVLGAASALIERDGLAALSMRRLGRELDVQAMALYRYVPGREQLIDWVVDLVVDELYADPEVLLVPTGGWQDYLSRLAYGLRRMALAHPHLFPLVATRPPTAPWVRPPLRSLRWIESFLAALSSDGFSDDAFATIDPASQQLDGAAVALRATPTTGGHLTWRVFDVGSRHVGCSAPLAVRSEFALHC